MKKLSIFIAIILLILCLTACDPAWPDIDSIVKIDEIVSIEKIDYSSPNRKKSTIFYRIFNDPIPFENGNYAILDVIDKEEEQEFIEKLSQYVYVTSDRWNSPDGISIKITYNNGEFLIINYDYIGEYSADGTYIKRYGVYPGKKEDYEEMISNCFDE